jgi:ATP-dependent DNA helicase RecG
MAKNTEIISNLQYYKGVGPVKAKALMANNINTAQDLLNYIPRTYIDRSPVSSLQSLSVKLMNKLSYEEFTSINSISPKNETTIMARIIDKKEIQFGRAKKMLSFKIIDFSRVTANIIFWSRTDFYGKKYKIDDNILVSGKAELDKYNTISFNHPEIEILEPDDEMINNDGRILPVYSMTDRMTKSYITQKTLRNLIENVIEKELENIEETLPNHILEKYNLPDIKKTYYSLHFPKTFADLELAKKRLKFEEIFYFEIFLAGKQSKQKITEKGAQVKPKSQLARKLYENLSFELTSDQKKVIREIVSDMESGKPMNRLLQGDVGSGKTIVSLLAMLVAIDSGYQVAMVAPTELLAEQHYHTISKLLTGFELKIVQLIGGQKTRLRNQILDDIKTGYSNIIIGTHALFEDTVFYNNLGLIIIDEQHRFGVAQRADIKELGKRSLLEKEEVPHILVMSATPIPRTLSMTVYGDLDVSIINEKPKNRIPIKTSLVFESEMAKAYSFIRSEIKNGNQAFIVYPLVEDSEKLELKSAISFHEKLKLEVFPDLRIGLLHGQMFWYEKEETMMFFKNKEFDILVATTVIEVGIDIPSATIMMIENAERFGLSQLHQLRGRVGRSDLQSYCILATQDKFKFEIMRKGADENNQKSVIIRLKAMCDTDDGFKISEIDLKLRGPGDVLGTKQAGLPNFKFLDLSSDGEIITLARKEAFSIIEKDFQLRNSENVIVRKNYLKQFKEKNYFGVA